MKRGRSRVASVVVTAVSVSTVFVAASAGTVRGADPVMPARALALKANDLLYDPGRGVIYASVPTSAGPSGNSIVTINPSTATVVSTVYGGSDPDRLALSDDGTMLYVGLIGANGVRQYSLPGMVFVREFSLGSSPLSGPMFAEDIDVMPGHPSTVAVSRSFRNLSTRHAGVAILDSGLQRPTTSQSFIGSNEIEFGSATRIYGESIEAGGYRLLTVAADGVSEQSVIAGPFGGDLEYAGGRIYTSDSSIVDPETGAVLARLTTPDDLSPFAINVAAHRAYYLLSLPPFSIQRLHVFDTDSFAEVGTYAIAGMDGRPAAMTRWGTDGVAIATLDGYVFIASPGTVTAPVPPITPLAAPAYPFKAINQVANSLAYDALHDRLYATLGAAAPPNPNVVVGIDPSTATIKTTTPVEDPVTVSISDDSSTLYVGLRTSGSVAQFSLPGMNAVRQFSIGSGPSGPLYPDDIAVMPGQASTIAVAGAPSHDRTAIFDNGTARHDVPSAMFHGSSRIAFGSPTQLYGLSNTSTGDVERMSVGAAGLTSIDESRQLLEESGDGIQYADGVVYGGSGRAVDPQTLRVLGTMGGPFNRFVVDPAQHREYVVQETFSFEQRLEVYDTSTFRLLETYSLPSFSGPAIALTRWGSNGLAFATADGPIYILSKDFAPPPVDPPPVDPPPADPPVDPPVELGALGEYTALTPTRLVDTRVRPGALPAGGTIDVQITGAPGVPSGNVAAVVLNVTATGALQPGYLTVWPSDETQPLISNVNFAAGQTVPNLVTVAVSVEGAIRVFSNAQSDVVVDLEGYYADSAGTPGGRFHPLTPSRLFDTRSGLGGIGTRMRPSSLRSFNVNGRAGLPPNGATAVVMNVTVTEPTASGYLTVYPDGAAIPLVSNLNFVANQTVPNLVIVKVPASGVIDMYNSAGNTNVLADVVGYFDEDRTDESGRFLAFSPERVYDSRQVTADHPAEALGPGRSLTFVDDLGATGYVFNVTATEPTSAGYLTVYPLPGEIPLASNVNFVAGQTVPNLVYAPAGPDVGFFNSAGNTHIVIDLFGAFT